MISSRDSTLASGQCRARACLVHRACSICDLFEYLALGLKGRRFFSRFASIEGALDVFLTW